MIINPKFWLVYISNTKKADVIREADGDPKKFGSFHQAECAGARTIDKGEWDTYYVLGPEWEGENV